jgi:hypothetical protein
MDNTLTVCIPDKPATAEQVNRDIVDSVVACAGYTRRAWWPVTVFAALNAFTSGLLLAADSWLAAGAMWLLGAVVVLWVITQQNDHESQTLSMRNALERRFGLPEYARHRNDYSPFWDGE